MKFLSFFFLVFLSLTAMAEGSSPLSSVAAALRRALDSSAEWTMTRQIGEKGPKLVSSGTVDCVAGSGIVWRVKAPFESAVSMTTNAMVFTDEEGARVKSLSDLPYYEAIRKKTDAFASGDESAFDGLFLLERGTVSTDGWKLKLKPEIAAMRKHLFSEVLLTGSVLPTNAVLKTADGGSCVIQFHAKR